MAMVKNNCGSRAGTWVDMGEGATPTSFRIYGPKTNVKMLNPTVQQLDF